MKARVTLKIVVEALDGTHRDWVHAQEGNFDSEQAITAYVLTRIAKVIGEQGILETHSALHATFTPWRRILDLDCRAEVLSSLAVDGDIEAAKHVAAAAKAADDLIRGNDGTIPFREGAKTGKSYKN